jgi:hypothetical protein
MDRDIWTILMNSLRRVERRIPRPGRRCCYSDRLIVKMLLWAVGHDRPMCWACRREHYHTVFRPKRLPSISQFSRRLRKPRIAQVLQQMHRDLLGAGRAKGPTLIDGKALPVSDYSRDPDARDGYGSGRMHRGYKLHSWVRADGRIARFIVRPLNEGEPKIARQLVCRLPRPTLILGDGNYDSAGLYQAVHETGNRLLTPLKGRSRSSQRWRRMGEGRRQALRVWRRRPDVCQRLGKRRDIMEGAFGTLSGFGGGLAPLPAWVRRLDRVTRWVTVKIMIYHARLNHQKGTAA